MSDKSGAESLGKGDLNENIILFRHIDRIARLSTMIPDDLDYKEWHKYLSKLSLAVDYLRIMLTPILDIEKYKKIEKEKNEIRPTMEKEWKEKYGPLKFREKEADMYIEIGKKEIEMEYTFLIKTMFDNGLFFTPNVELTI